MTNHAIETAGELTAAVLACAESVHPGVIVEVGPLTGEALWIWRSAFPAAALYGVTADRAGLDDRGATVLEGDTRDRATLRRLRDQLGGRAVDVLCLSGGTATTRSDWRTYEPLVRDGGLVVVRDVAHSQAPDDGPWEEIKQECGDDGHTVTEVVSRDRPAGFGIVRK